MKCPRCGVETNTSTGSYLNSEEICLNCKEEEKNHPLYQLAKKVEAREVLKGNYSYPGLLEEYKGNNELIVVMEAIDREDDETILEKLTDYIKKYRIHMPLIFALIRNNICFREECLSWLGCIKASSIKNREAKEGYKIFMKQFSHDITGNITNLSKLMAAESQKTRDLYTTFCASYYVTENNVGPFC